MGLIAALCTVLAGLASTYILVRDQESGIEQQIQATATTLLSLGLSDYSGLEDFEKLDAFIAKSLDIEELNQIIHIFNSKGKLILTSAPKKEQEDLSVVFKEVKKPTFDIFRGKKKYKILIMPYKSESGRIWYLQIAMPSPLYRDVVYATAWQTLILFFVLVALALFIADKLAQRLIQPVREIAYYVHRLNPAESKEWKPLALTPQSEGEYLNDIASGINSLALRIRTFLYSLSRTSRYLAHELRNPLTILTGEAETILSKNDATTDEFREVLQSSLEEIQRINDVVTTVMKVFKREKTAYTPSLHDLTLWMEEKLPKWEKHLQQKIHWDRPQGKILDIVDTDLLERVLDNLVRNVKAHTPPGTFCSISLTSENFKAKIIFEDNGPGLAPELITVLNEQNVMDERIGIGLGLCLEIAAICHFKMIFANKPEGGLRVTIVIE
jgi:signal transduction histidine kinase